MQPTLRLSLHDRFGYRLAVLTRRWRALVDAELESYGLSQATWRPLVHLASFKTSPRQCELAEQLQIGCPALVRLLDNLEEKGLIERALVDGDRRAHHIQLTREGRRLATQVYEIILDIERRLLSEVSATDLDRCTRVLAAIENQIDTPVAEAQPRKKRRAS
jgi:MarR family transcriptional regulator, transcriptional regulator for hemolysin